MDSILTSIKKLLGIEEEYTHFDTDIIMHINTVFMTLQQLGVGPKNGFTITDKESTWNEFFGPEQLEAAKTYVYLKVRLLFDPPSNSFLVDALERHAKEIEWRLQVQAEGGD